jgi:hypothetical protein
MPDAHAEGLPKLQQIEMRRRYPTGVPERLCHAFPDPFSD